jgi:hypothetical protein
MNAQIITRGFVGALAIVACALMLIAIPNTSDAHTSKSASSTTSSMKDVEKQSKKNLLNASSTSNVDVTCMSEAVDVRETALIDAWNSFNANTLTILNNRKSALHSAWEITTIKERTAALVSAWKTWRSDKKEVTAEFRKERKAAWGAFKKTARDECRVATPKEESLEKSSSDSISL